LKLLRCISLFFPLFLACYAGNAQLPSPATPASNLRTKTIALSADSVLLDTLSIVPQTFSIAHVGDSLYRLDFVRAILYWKQKPALDSVQVTYRVFPYRLNATVQRLSFDSVMNNFYTKPFEFNNNKNGANGLFDFGNIQYNGSFGRGLSFGNNQDAVVSSNFQLQLNGMLGDSIEVAAALTDNNLPIQADGTTQQLNEFDQVFLQFKKKDWQLNLGDIDLRQNDMYFLNFYKRLQGISFQTSNQITPTVRSNTLVSGSIAKGKFTRNIFQGLEGNQGPYRLTGANNEVFFIVLPGTERVFIDGELLQRGEDGDYVINYNTAEVTFTPRRMITKDSRIQIEFEYADRNYLNANLYLNETVAVNKKLKIRLGLFNNSDAKNSSINQVLDARQKQTLFEAGDSINQAFYPTAVLDTFSATGVYYERLYDSTSLPADSFYQYTAEPTSAVYSLAFTDVGAGSGNYVADFNGANGKVYRYVKPVDGIKQGQYEPVTLLVTPKKQQLLTLGADYQIDKSNAVKAEVAMSNYDVNTFSPKGGGDDQGGAAKFQYTNTTLLNAAKGLQLTSGIDYEHVQQKFKPLERIRSVEFTREWGLPLVLEPATETITRLSTNLQNKANQGLSYQFLSYQRSDNYKGFQNILQQNSDWKGWMLNNRLALTNFNTSQNKGYFFRPVIDVSKQLKRFRNLRTGFRYALEQNNVKEKSYDSLNLTSFSFDTYTAYLKTDETKKNQYGLTLFTRADKYPYGKTLVKGDRSYNVTVQSELLKSEKHQFLFNTTYRKLVVYDTLVSSQKDDETVLGRAEYRVNEFHGFITGNVFYELGTGQEQRKDFAYLEVPAGQGQYIWNDYDSNQIQSLNEFEIAVFQDQARFIRILVPTNEYIKANYTTFNYSFTFNPRTLFGKKESSRISKFAARFNWQTSMQKSKKSIAKVAIELNPFKYELQDTALLTLNTSLLNTLSFNRFSQKWGLDISNLQNTGKALLTYGYESRKLIDWQAKVRWNISTAFTFELNKRWGENALYTPSFDNRNYQLKTYAVEPRLVFVNRTVFRLQTGYKYEQKKNNPLYGGETSASNAVTVETKYNVLQNSSINGRFTYNNISYHKLEDTPANATVSYIMLDALLPGNNFLWSLDFTKRLMKNIELNFQYEGRKPSETKTIHTGRASIRALF